ncbi:M23 family metallopeptidase [Rivularia sp. UHCC 0363]|uniref:LysM peptidoglycan-binding domain-containing M23 family metallopeptidase n=1 Tax=Rivularia sp. UHCC 0363 TaxID=3110244 RepID=UPI002B1F5D89|nr:M23 family metallopeptidase [Rivularia sp. UHCC 0363]MEA5593763.1 M23 family metallopeptidase [Rivularia sp. UHCC 0363]
MSFRSCSVLFYSLVGIFGLISTFPNLAAAQSEERCPTPALERFVRHQVAVAETLETIAQSYDITPATIIRMNPTIRNGKVTVGQNLIIPPYDGIVEKVPRGQTLREIAAKHKIRVDALFEINGCQENPQVVFVPELKKSPNSTQAESNVLDTVSNSNKLTGYPLPEKATVAFPYGWQINPSNGDVFFHSGIDLSAQPGTSVTVVGKGVVVFAEKQGSYGNLVIINHSNGLQSRYAHLQDIKVSVGKEVNKGDLLGTVGATGTPTVKQPHLHFEIRSSSSLGWVAKDPSEYLK